MSVPTELRTARLLLRSWRVSDAEHLSTVLQENAEHLGAWIPARVATPVPLPSLRERLRGFADDFAASREWRYGLFVGDDDDVLGELSVFPRNAAGRAPFAIADHVELGYWVRADATGRGFATEAARAVFTMVSGISRFTHVEIRCDPRNVRSAAVPVRLGFVLTATMPYASGHAEAPTAEQVWRHALPARVTMRGG
jgi:RimJ/RimL family protein N-acetyltransferase